MNRIHDLLLMVTIVSGLAVAQPRTTGNQGSSTSGELTPTYLSMHQLARPSARAWPGGLDQDRVDPSPGMHFSPRRPESSRGRVESTSDVPQTFTVTTTNDTGAGSLRKAIHDANLHAGLDYIQFDISGLSMVIQPLSNFETITSPVILDATTQPGYVDQPIVELDGTLDQTRQGTDDFIGIAVNAPGSIVRGFVVHNFEQGILVDTSGGVTIEGNFVGTDALGQSPLPNSICGIGLYGPNCVVGGTTPGTRNVISGNFFNIEILGNGYLQAQGSDIRIQGNIIGLNVNGTDSMSNSGTISGIYIRDSGRDTIGGKTAAARNYISGNFDGIYLGLSSLSTDNLIQGNFIGLDITGMNAIGNNRAGILVFGAVNTTIGGRTPGARNIIAGNLEEGVRLRAGATGNLVQGNYIGTDSTGANAIGNGNGIYSKYAQGNTIGGAQPGAWNLIVGSLQNGVFLDTMTTATSVTGNDIGVTYIAGVPKLLGNQGKGIWILESPRNIVGGTDPFSGNIIGGNTESGVDVQGDSSVGNIIQRNYIGTDPSGAKTIGNKFHGVFYAVGASNNLLGGAFDTLGNVIAYNGFHGVFVADGIGNTILSNSIHDNAQFGISLSPYSPVLNDPGDGDTGPNNLQNFPVIDSVIRKTTSTTIKGRLNSEAAKLYTIQLFENQKGDPSGYGEGERHIGSELIATDINGNGSFSIDFPYVVSPDSVFSATATDDHGNTSEFSRVTKLLEILRPQPDELWITDDIDTIKWKVTTPVAQVNIMYSTDDGQNFTFIPGPVPADPGEYHWHIPKGLLSKKGRITIYDPENPDIVDTSGAFRIKGVELTRDSADAYVRYRPERHGWPFPNDTNHLWPSTWWSQFDYAQGLDLLTANWYHSEGFPKAPASSFPDWPLFVETFGVGQCYYPDPGHPGQVIAPKPAAVARWKAISGDWGGSCWGMSLSSILAYDDISAFKGRFTDAPGVQFDLQNLSITNSRRMEINRLFTTQYGQADINFTNASYDNSPMVTVAELRTLFLEDVRNDPVLEIFNVGGKGAHAINPYKIERSGSGSSHLRIYVYDNRLPGDTTRFVDVDTVADTWTYAAGLNWGGDKGMFISLPYADYLSDPAMSELPLTVKRQRGSLQIGDTLVEVYNTPNADIFVTDAFGDTIGFRSNSIINKMPGAAPIMPKTGIPRPPQGYVVPSGKSYNVAISGSADSVVRFAAFTDSTVFSFSRAGVQSSETDRLRFGSGLDVASADPVSKKADLSSIIIHPDQQRVVSLMNAVIRQGDSLHLEIFNGQFLKVVNSGDSLRYDLDVRFASQSGSVPFTHSSLLVPPHSTVQVVPAWDSIAFAPAKILIDHTNSGTFDDSLVIDNQSFDWYLDSLRFDSRTTVGGRPAGARLVLNKPAPHGGIRVSLSSSAPDSAIPDPSVLIPEGQVSFPISVTTQIVQKPDTVVITGSAGNQSRKDTLILTPQGVEFVRFVRPAGVFGGDTVSCTVILTNPAPSGGLIVSLSSSKPALVSVPVSITIPDFNISNSIVLQAAEVSALDSAVITAQVGLTSAAGKLKVSPVASFANAQDTVVGGNWLYMAVVLGVPAPSGGLNLQLRSSDSVTASHSSIYLPAGATQAYAYAYTTGVANDSVITYVVANSNPAIQHTLLVRPATMKTFTHALDDGCVVGEHGNSQTRFLAGNAIRFHFELNGEAPPGGGTAHLTSDQPGLFPPVSVTTGKWAWDWYFGASSTDQVASQQQVIITLTYRSASLNDTILVVPRPHFKLVDLGEVFSNSAAWSVNNAGRVLAQGSSGLFFWKDGLKTPLSSYPGFKLSISYNVRRLSGVMNDSGYIAGEYNGHAAYWKPDTTIELPDPPGVSPSTGIAINNYDEVLGTAGSTAGGYPARGVFWGRDSITLLDHYTAGLHEFPIGFNDSGEVVGGAVQNNLSYGNTGAALKWDHGHISWSLDGAIPNEIPLANVINNAGLTAGEYYYPPGYDQGLGWFIRQGTDTVNLGPLIPYYGMSPLGINRAGDVVGNMWWNDFETYPFPFLYKDGLYYDLNCITDSLPPRMALATANAINDRGVIAGSIRNDTLNQTRPCVIVPAGISVGVDDARNRRIPAGYKLDQNYPNPFNPTTLIQFELPKESQVRLVVYNILGQVVANLLDRKEPAGYYSMPFNAGSLSSGVYFYRLTAGDFSSIRKMMVIK